MTTMKSLDLEASNQVTFVVNSVSNQKFEKFTTSLTRASGGIKFNIVRISDAISMAEGLNRGASDTTTKYLIFCHDDIEFVSPNPISKILGILHYYDFVGIVGTENLVSGNWYDAGQPYIQGSVLAPSLGTSQYELQIFGAGKNSIQDKIVAIDGLFIACRAKTFRALNGFDSETFSGWHGYDIDLSFRAHLAKATMCIASDVLIYHDSHSGHFTDAKLEEYAVNQYLIARKFVGKLSKISGLRTHINICVNDTSEAIASLQRRRLQTPLVNNPLNIMNEK